MSNVTTLFPQNTNLGDRLRELADIADRGELVSIAMVGLSGDRQILSGHTNLMHAPYTLVGGLHALSTEILIAIECLEFEAPPPTG